MEGERNEIEKIDPQKPDLSQLQGESKYKQVREVSEHILERRGKTSEGDTLSGPDISTIAQQEFPEVDFNKSTFLQYLSVAAADPESSISTQGRRKGFYVSRFAEEVAHEEENEIDTEVSSAQRKKRVDRERRLYPVLVDWVQQQGYRTRDTSAYKNPGKWSNPDVTGIRATETFDRTELEVLTVEAKPSVTLWDQWIFEAVSHKRFANRSYFAFSATQEAIPKLPRSEMRYYADLYGIGILVVVLGDETYRSLIEENQQEDIGLDEADVVEIYSAPFSYVQPRWQMDYCAKIGIGTHRDLYTWGEDLLSDY